MERNKTVLDKIYDEAKERRIALTLEEYAEKIGTSRASLFRYRKTPDSIDPELIERANKLLSETKKVSRETGELTKAPQGKIPKRTKPGELIDFYDTDFAAGEIEFYDDNNTIAPAYKMDIPDFAGCTAFRTYGTSMEKLIKSGSILFGTKIEDWKSHLEYGQIYGIVCTDKRRYLKYIRKASDDLHFLLKSENKENYDDMALPKKAIKSIWLIHGWINKRT